MADMTCNWCDESGASESMPMLDAEGNVGDFWYHPECELRHVLGGLKHHGQLCSCFDPDGDNEPPDGMTRHDEALEVARLVGIGEWNFG